jgi:hypothetical protein
MPVALHAADQPPTGSWCADDEREATLAMLRERGDPSGVLAREMPT